MRSLAVVPAYNEAATVGDVVRGLRVHAPEFDIVVVDDGSTDATREVAEAAGANTIRHPFNLGIGGAVQSGFAYALENGYDRMVQLDGAGQHNPAEIDKLIEEMIVDDVVFGSRIMAGRVHVVARSRLVSIRLCWLVIS